VKYVAVAAAACALTVGAHADVVQVQPPTLPIVEQRLANGLDVIVAPDPNVASVAVHVRYGSLAPLPLVERLMFAGSVHVGDGDFDARITAAGGWAGSVAATDHLSVFEQAPAEALELVLWLEAERMAGLADGVTTDAIHREDRAFATADTSLAAEVDVALWGPRLRGDAAAVRDVIRAYLTPHNAILVITGKVDPAATLALAQKYFGWLPGPDAPLRPAHEQTPLTHGLELARRDPIPKAIVAVRTNEPWASDTIALEVAARVLVGGRRGRMQRALVDAGLASEVHVDVVHQHGGGELRFTATAKPGVEPQQLATAMRATIVELRDRGVDVATVRAAAAALDAELVTSLESLAVRADQIAAWAAYTGNASYLDNARAAFRAIRPDDVRRALAYWCADSAFVTAVGK
jgi:predicted Zn-dependent peptidase